MKNGMILFGILFLLAFSMIPAHAPESGNSGNDNGKNLILLKNAHINTDNTVATMKVQSASAGPGSKYYLIQFDGHVTAEYKKAVEAEGAVLHGYIPNNAYLAKISDSDYASVSSLPFVKWIGPYLPNYKIAPSLQSKTGLVEVNVILFDSADNASVIAQIEADGGQITDSSGSCISAIINSSIINEIAAIDEVEWIEEKLEYRILNNNATMIMNVTPVRNNYGINGSGQIIAIADTGLDTGYNNESMHDDLEGRIISINDTANDGDVSDTNGHGTHVAGSALGNGARSGGLYSGAATEAQLIFQAIGDSGNTVFLPSDLNDLFIVPYNENSSARIHSNSWGAPVGGEYNNNSKEVDEFVWNHPDMLIIFAAGNEGPDPNTLDSPGTAKNCLTVGATENLQPAGGSYSDNSSEIGYFLSGKSSSRGPTDDGRIKPDVMAPGTWVISTYPNNQYAYLSGTSMATPLTAGTAALVRQYYVENEFLINPTAALIKATLINGAVDVGSHATIYDQGWGRVDLKNTLFPDAPSGIRYYDNITLNTSESWQIQQNFSNVSTLKISLVWTDYPGTAASAKTLINDLDLFLESPNGTIYYANGSQPDRINNVEQICLENFESGWYNVSVNGTDVPEGPQPFALVISGAFDDEPPLSVIELNETAKGYSWINWTWAHLDEDDLNHTLIYIDGTLNGSTSNYYYNATGFLPNTTHNISILAVDRGGNINQTWVNDSASTIPDNTAPTINSVTNSTPFAGREMNVSVNATDNHRVDIVMANNQILNYTGNNLWNGTIIAGAGIQPLNVSATDVAGNINWSISSYVGLILPQANFTSNVTSGNKPLSVQFWNNSTNATSISWDFDGNGTGDSNESTPVWTFTEAGNHSVTLNATNENGSDIYTGYIVVTTPTTTTKKSSSGGGGGGGGGATGEDYENILFKDFAIQYLEKGTPATYEFNEEGNTIQSIKLTANKNAGQIKVIIEVLKNTSTIAGEKPEGEVYSNINIWAGNAAFKDSIENAVITFHASKDWLANHGVSAEDIVMAMYTDDGWIELESISIVSDTGDYVVYEAETQKLASPFAITSNAISEEGNIAVNQLSEGVQAGINETQPGETPREVEDNALSTIGILPCALLLAGAYLVLRRNQ